MISSNPNNKHTHHYDFIPYSHQSIDNIDIDSVTDILHSDWITTGPAVGKFERIFAEFVTSAEAVAVSSGTAALHAAMYAIGIDAGDEVIVPPMTFAATANCVVFQRGRPVFADVLPDTLLIDPDEVVKNITTRTKAIIAVDYAGQPCDYDALLSISRRHNLTLVADACHSLGGKYKNRSVGSLADLSVFSFHPAKHITTGEGGMITTNESDLARQMKIFRNHGITTDLHQREAQGSWFYEMTDLGYNYRLTDFQCALGISQMKNLPDWVRRRQEIAQQYSKAFKDIPSITPLLTRADSDHAFHLYVVKMNFDELNIDRMRLFRTLRDRGIGINIHYIPVHLHPYYRKHFNTAPGSCPVAESAYEQIVSLPMYPGMTDQDVDRVISEISAIITPKG